MTINCYDNTYVIHFTDSRKGTISIPRKSLITDQLDIALVGKNRLEYGEIFDENILHLLENFAAPQDTTITTKVVPNISQTYGSLLSHPVSGQTWYNTTKKRFYLYDGVTTSWLALGLNNDVAGNRGVISHGMALPRPLSPVTGYQFTYPECSWNISPFILPSELDYLECFTDANAVVTMRYKVRGSSSFSTGMVNYQIIGIKDNTNEGNTTPINPSNTQGPTPTPTPTPSITPSRSGTPRVTPSHTMTPTVTPTLTPTPSSSPGIETYLYTTWNPTGNFGTINYGEASPLSFTNKSTGSINSAISGPLSTDGGFVYIPSVNKILVMGRQSSSMGEFATIFPDSFYEFYGTAVGPHPSGGKVLYTLQRQKIIVDGTTTGRLRAYVPNSQTGIPANTGATATFPINGYDIGIGIDYSNGMCTHNQFLITTAPPNMIYAFLFDGVHLKQIASFTLPTNTLCNGVKSDGTYIYVQNSYSTLMPPQPPRTILKFSGSGFTQVLSATGLGERDIAFGDGYMFSSPVNGSTIQARSWNGTTLSSVISSVASNNPYYRGLFAYSPLTNRLYNPVDANSTLSKIYTWNGVTFTTLIPFMPNLISSQRMISFDLFSMIDQGLIVSPAPSGTSTASF